MNLYVPFKYSDMQYISTYSDRGILIDGSPENLFVDIKVYNNNKLFGKYMIDRNLKFINCVGI